MTINARTLCRFEQLKASHRALTDELERLEPGSQAEQSILADLYWVERAMDKISRRDGRIRAA